MLAVVIADNLFAGRERDLLRRLEVGLADEGVRIVHAVPESFMAASGDGIGLQSSMIPFPDGAGSTGGWVSRRRARELCARVAALHDEPISIVHVFGSGCWSIGVDIARIAGAPLLVEVFDAQTSARVRELAGTDTAVVLSPERRLVEQAVANVPAARVIHVPWGVHAPESPRRIERTGRARSLALLFDTAEPRTMGACLEGVSRLPAGHVLMFGCLANPTRAGEARLRAAVRKFGLLERMTICPELECRRAPTLAMDFLLRPEASGRASTLSLECMAQGVAVVAARDAAIEHLSDPSLVSLVERGSPAAWHEAVARLLGDPQAFERQVAAAHRFVRAHRSASAHIASVLQAYRHAMTPLPARLS